MLIFQVLLPVREPSVAAFSESRAITSPKDIVKQGMKISKVWQKHKSFWSQALVVAVKIALKC